MSKVYFTSDLHLGHNNLCVSLRGMTAEESDNLIVENWNKVVIKYDIVYILGDVVMEKPNNLVLLEKLNGKIRVIGGNHDNAKVCRTLSDMDITVMGCLEYKGFICTHLPVHPSELNEGRYMGNIHGHIHLGGTFREDAEGNKIDDWEYKPETNLGPKYINVNVELNNYTPVPFEEIVNRMSLGVINQYK